MDNLTEGIQPFYPIPNPLAFREVTEIFGGLSQPQELGSEDLSLAVHYAENRLCRLYDEWVVSRSVWNAGNPTRDFYKSAIQIGDFAGVEWIFNIILDDTHQNEINGPQILSFTLKELKGYEKACNMTPSECFAIETLWGTERSILARNPHRVGPNFGNLDEVKITIKALSDYDFIEFCETMDTNPSQSHVIRLQPWFGEKLSRVRDRLGIIREKQKVAYSRIR